MKSRRADRCRRSPRRTCRQFPCFAARDLVAGLSAALPSAALLPTVARPCCGQCAYNQFPMQTELQSPGQILGRSFPTPSEGSPLYCTRKDTHRAHPTLVVLVEKQQALVESSLHPEQSRQFTAQVFCFIFSLSGQLDTTVSASPMCKQFVAASLTRVPGVHFRRAAQETTGESLISMGLLVTSEIQ